LLYAHALFKKWKSSKHVSTPQSYIQMPFVKLGGRYVPTPHAFK
jgi:hypothetical protein